MFKRMLALTVLCLVFIAGFATVAMAADEDMVFGILLVGPYNDKGYSQATFEGAQYAEKMVPGTKLIYLDKVNPADRPGFTIPQLVDDLVSKGAKLIIANSDDMKDGVREAAKMHPDVKFLHVSGDDVLGGKAPENLSNVFGKMIYGKMMAGFAAAMTTKTGKIGFLGPLVNDETRRLASAAYLGARYAWEKVLKKDPKDLKFQVTWIGFWFNIPGVTADPTQVANKFFDGGYDVVLSSIDTPEAVTVASQKSKAGKNVWAVPYDYEGACEGFDNVCLGVPYFNWGPAFAKFVKEAKDGTFKQVWEWNSPNWANIDDPATSAVGYAFGPALSAEAKGELEKFINGLGDGSINLYTGPLNSQDGTPFLKAGEKADEKKLWYMGQLLEGMEGASSK
jgi:simple sugar transport system substrate-binding protein